MIAASALSYQGLRLPHTLAMVVVKKNLKPRPIVADASKSAASAESKRAVASTAKKPTAWAGEKLAASAGKRSAASAGKKLRVGSHCSGWLSESQALENLGIDHQVTFACDNNLAVKTLIQDNFEVENWFDDMMETPAVDFPKVHLYTCGFPCQPYSSAGKHKGIKDPRAKPQVVMQKYIKFAKPAIVILENVATYVGPANRKPFQDLIKFLESCGYSTQHKVLCTSDFGIPQNRRRVYIVAIQKRLVRLPFAWPKPIGHIPLSKMWDRDRRGIIVKSTKIPEDIINGKTTFDNLQQTFKKLKKMKLVPSQTDCILDLGASSRFATFKIDMAPTLTASRCVFVRFVYNPA